MNGSTFPGYSTGKNRVGSDMNVITELRQPQTISGQRYDTLILTERHDLLSTITWENTVKYARHFHDRLIDGNSQANTYLYHSWLGLPDKSNPRSWINYERTVAPAWQCVASRINESLQYEGRSDRVVYMPTGLALASLVEQATQGTVAGITGSSVQNTVNSLFKDEVHLTPLGMYYMALVNFSSVYRRSPVGAWAPAEVNATQALSLQSIAWAQVANHFNSFVSPTLAQCRVVMRDSVCSAYYNFTSRPDQIEGCANQFSSTNQDNPFYFNASTDAGYWFPRP